jgi:hypothetical protein
MALVGNQGSRLLKRYTFFPFILETIENKNNERLSLSISDPF